MSGIFLVVLIIIAVETSNANSLLSLNLGKDRTIIVEQTQIGTTQNTKIAMSGREIHT